MGIEIQSIDNPCSTQHSVSYLWLAFTLTRKQPNNFFQILLILDVDLVNNFETECEF